MLSSEASGEGGGIIWLGQFLLPCDDTNCGRGLKGATSRMEDKEWVLAYFTNPYFNHHWMLTNWLSHRNDICCSVIFSLKLRPWFVLRLVGWNGGTPSGNKIRFIGNTSREWMSSGSLTNLGGTTPSLCSKCSGLSSQTRTSMLLDFWIWLVGGKWSGSLTNGCGNKWSSKLVLW